MNSLKALVFLVALTASGGSASSPHSQGDDSTFAATQERGKTAMGVDQYISDHVFEPLPNGGRIVLQRDATDSAGVDAIRAHMRDIAQRFATGDFATPGFAHAHVVPGTDVMTAKRANIRYAVDTLEGGAMVTILTSDSATIDAVQRFLAFQRTEHHSGMQMHDMDRVPK